MPATAPHGAALCAFSDASPPALQTADAHERPSRGERTSPAAERRPRFASRVSYALVAGPAVPSAPLATESSWAATQLKSESEPLQQLKAAPESARVASALPGPEQQSARDAADKLRERKQKGKREHKPPLTKNLFEHARVEQKIHTYTYTS
jgi:hypothetical protein